MVSGRRSPGVLMPYYWYVNASEQMRSNKECQHRIIARAQVVKAVTLLIKPSFPPGSFQAAKTHTVDKTIESKFSHFWNHLTLPINSRKGSFQFFQLK